MILAKRILICWILVGLVFALVNRLIGSPIKGVPFWLIANVWVFALLFLQENFFQKKAKNNGASHL
jgi:hypothetical protein